MSELSTPGNEPQRLKPEAVWFGSTERPLAGFLHRPRRPAVGGVAICPPFGYEAACAHRTLRRLADRLADDGNLVLRFDYEGSNASSGSGSEPDLLSRWQDSVSAAVAELRRLGIARPSLVGLRIGAGLASAELGRDHDLGSVVLWAPVTSGRRYYRELRAQSLLAEGGAVTDGSLTVVGHRVPAGMLRSLKSWQPLAEVGDRDADLLVVQSPGWRGAADASADLAAAGITPTSVEVAGTAEVLEREAEVVVVPEPLLSVISEWLSRRPGSAPTTPPGVVREDDQRRVFDDGLGLVAEEIVSIPPAGLYGVLTEPVDRPARHAVVFLNNGVAPAVGPARAWVEWGRALAVDGFSSLRFDLSGLGDSPDLSSRPITRENSQPSTASRDFLAAVRYLRGRGIRSVTAVGLCSGAQTAVRTVAYQGDVESVFAINGSLYYLPDIGVGPWARRLWKWTAWPMSKRRIRNIVYIIPEIVWTLFDRISLFPSPTRYLRRAAERGTRVRLVFAAGDKALRDLEVRAPTSVRQLVSSGETLLSVIEGMDHSMFNVEHRRAVLEILRADCHRAQATADDALSSEL